MNPLLLAFIPGALVGLGIALMLLRAAPRRIRTVDVLERLDAAREPIVRARAAADAKAGDKIGTWLYAHAGDEKDGTNIPGFTTPTKALDLLEMDPASFYYRKFSLAVAGFLMPVLIVIPLALVTGAIAAIPLLICPVFAFVMWITPDFQARARAAERRREFTRFVTVYLELVAVALLSNTTADAALTSAASVSDSWVFKRIRTEYRIADTVRTSKWQALERLGTSVEVPALVRMARMMRLSEAHISIRDQLRAACDQLRAQVVDDASLKAQKASSNMQFPIVMTIFPVMALILIPTALQFSTI